MTLSSTLEAYSQSIRPDILDSIPLGKYYSVHFHEIVYSFVFYNVLFLVSPSIGKLFFGKVYTGITNRKLLLNFDIHIIAMIQALISIGLCAPLILTGSYGLQPLDSRDITLFGYDYAHGFVTAVTVGYFLWDFIICLVNFDLFGYEFLIHAVASLSVFSSCFLPMFFYWVPRFLIFELSSPFVNINWFISTSKAKTGWLSSVTLNIVNGILLMVTFFCTRIVWGFYAIFLVINHLKGDWSSLNASETTLGCLLVGINFTLDILNIFWFRKMVRIAVKLATKSSAKVKKVD